MSFEWIKCSERLPEKDGFYLVYPRLNGWSESWFNGGKFAISRFYGAEVTHWLPLPAPPEEL